jgi:hypothetical protein
MAITMNLTAPRHFFIPRDPNMKIPALLPQNAMLINGKKRVFNFHSVPLTHSARNLSYSIHFQLRPLSANLSYLLIYQFDQSPPLVDFHRFKYLCPTGQ